VVIILRRAVDVNITPKFHQFSIKCPTIFKIDIPLSSHVDMNPAISDEITIKNLTIKVRECWRSAMRVSDESHDRERLRISPIVVSVSSEVHA
jgi:hypothetical protein